MLGEIARIAQGIAITEAAGLAARSIARLEKTAAAVHAAESERRERALQLVSTKGGFSALIRHGKTTIQIEGDDFAVSKSE
jgi:hypothetical protein